MNIKKRMSTGYILLIGLCISIGVISFTQSTIINESIYDFTDRKVKTIINADIVKFNSEKIILITQQYENREISDPTTDFNETYNIALESLEILKEINPHMEAYLNILIDVFYSIFSHLTRDIDGLFFLIESYLSVFSQIKSEVDDAETEINTLISYQNSDSLITDATELKNSLKSQILIIDDYYYEQDSSEKTIRKQEFDTLGMSFLDNIQSIIDSPNGQNKILANSIKTWYSNIYEPLFKSGSTSLFKILDTLLSKKNIFNDNIDMMNSYLTTLESDVETQVAQSIRNVKFLTTISNVVGIILILGAICIGIAIAVPTTKAIVKVNKKMEDTIKAGTTASITMANIAAELAASASEVTDSAEEISGSTQQVAEESREVMESSNEIKNLVELVNTVAEQTNLLSLNARSEAGKAGEYGKGFAIVANEFRKLAEGIKNSLESTNTMIDGIINKIKSTAHAMEAISAATEQQTASMEEVTSTVNNLSMLAENLKHSLVEQEISETKSTKKSKIKIKKKKKIKKA